MRPSFPQSLLALALVLPMAAPAAAQDHSQHAQGAAKTDDVKPDHSGHDGHPPAAAAKQPVHDHAAMGHATATQNDVPVEPIAPVTDADRAAAFPELGHAMQHGAQVNHYLLIDRLEAVDLDDGSGQAWELQGWIGGDTDRFWLRSEGERARGHTESADVEFLYGHSVSPWWDVVAGIKHDFKPGDSQTWGAFGFQGMSPYKFEIEATAYLGEDGRSAASFEAEYDVLLTNRLILQPLLEAELHGKDDASRAVGSGLSTIEAGLRLRYEFTRQFAPYVGVSHERAFGDTADYRRDDGEDTQDTRFVAGVRLWF
ncbi:MAG TPA: copper resistance protein B [Lysobacter sp.]